MIKVLLLTILLSSGLSFASSISQIPLEEMEQKSEYIILGKVVTLKSLDNRDEVTIEIRRIIKGTELSKKTVSFWLTSRGGLKDFDPQLKIGNSVVAFLNEENGKFMKAYWGSVSVFTKPNFL